MTGATSGSAGVSGDVPQPAAGQQGSFLRGDGTWQTVSAGSITNGTTNVTANAANVGFTVSGTQVLTLDGTHFYPNTTNSYALGGASNVFSNVYSTTFLAGAGAAATPSHSFAADTGTGLYDVAASHTLGVAINGSAVGSFTSTGLNGTAIGATTASTGAFTSLTANASAVWTAATLTNLNQLTNGPGYLTGITSANVTTALGYTPVNKAGDSMTGTLYVNGLRLNGTDGAVNQIWQSNAGTVMGITGNNAGLSLGGSTSAQNLFLDTSGNVTLENHGTTHSIYIGQDPGGTAYNVINLNGQTPSSMGLEGGGNSDSTLYVNSPGNLCFRPNGTGGCQMTMTSSSLSVAPGWVGAVNVNGPAQGSYGSISVAGNTSGWAGINFSDFYKTLMIRNDGYSGLYSNNNQWLWAFDQNGSLAAGTVPWGSLTGVPSLSTPGSNVSQFNNDSQYVSWSSSGTFTSAITFNGGPYTNDWFRVNGGNGIYWQTYGGGWYMQDSTWMRIWNGRSLYVAATMATDGCLAVGSGGVCNGWNAWDAGNMYVAGAFNAGCLAANIGANGGCGGYNFYVAGTGYISSSLTTGSVYYTSDQRLKTDFVALGDVSDKLVSLPAGTFRWNVLAKRLNPSLDDLRHLGTYAQMVETVFPEAVFTGADGYKRVDYPVLVVPLLAGWQTHQQKIAAQQAQIGALTASLADLRREVGEVTASLARGTAGPPEGGRATSSLMRLDPLLLTALLLMAALVGGACCGGVVVIVVRRGVAKRVDAGQGRLGG